MLQISDIRQTLDMIDNQHLDIRTITMGISLRDCAHPDMSACAQKVYDKICRKAEHLVETGCAIEREFGIPIVNKRISVTPIALVTEACDSGRVFINDKPAKASANVKEGDIITIAFGNKEVKVEVLDVQETVKKEEAKELFRYL